MGRTPEERINWGDYDGCFWVGAWELLPQWGLGCYQTEKGRRKNWRRKGRWHGKGKFGEQQGVGLDLRVIVGHQASRWFCKDCGKPWAWHQCHFLNIPGTKPARTFHLWLHVSLCRKHPAPCLNKGWDSGRSDHDNQAASHFASPEHSWAGCEPQRMEAALSDRDPAAAHSFKHWLWFTLSCGCNCPHQNHFPWHICTLSQVNFLSLNHNIWRLQSWK